jgi:dihydroorotate dehydrogenase
MYYDLIRKVLFQLEPETAHGFTLQGLKYAHALGISKLFSRKVLAPCEVMGLSFPNPVGLAAGMDKNGDYVDALATLGFGFIEVGTVTPRPQEGNPKPRVFRLPAHEAIINRLGFNNKGCDYLVKQLQSVKYKGILGVNIGKNFDTPIENANDDYLKCFQKVWPYASYVTINISSPNTKDLRDLQHGEQLQSLLRLLKVEQKTVFETHKKYVPLAVKLSPDLSAEQLREAAEIILAEKVDGVIATNTTLNRDGVDDVLAAESGGLSGKPLLVRSTNTIMELNALLRNKIPIIGVGGILSAADAQEKIQAGAGLVQVYSGLVYRGARLVREIAVAVGCSES